MRGNLGGVKMDCKKIQIEALKSDGWRKWSLNAENGKNYLINGERTVLYVIPDTELNINPKNFGDFKKPVDLDNENLEEFKLLRKGIYDFKTNKIILIFQNDDGEKIYIDKKLTKLFDIKKSKFKGTSKILSVYEDGEVVGLICGMLPPQDEVSR